MLGFKESLNDFFTNEMDVDFDVFAMSMKKWIMCHVDGALVVVEEVRNI